MTAVLVAADVLARHADHPSGYLALNRDTKHFTAAGLDGFVAYRASGGFLFQLGGPIAAPRMRLELLRAFLEFAKRERRRVCALELRAPDVPVYAEAGFRVNQLGLSYTLALAEFSLRGAPFVKLRNKIRRAERAAIEVAELGVEIPRTSDAWKELDAITAAWLRGKGPRRKLLAFLVGELGSPGDAARRIFVARRGGRVVALSTYVPMYGERPGLLLDLSRRMPDAPAGTMELLHARALERFRLEGVRFLSFGMTPFMGLSPETDSAPGRSRVVSWLLSTLAAHGGAIYPARSQADYKLKWNPTLVEPEYFAYEGRFRLGCLLRLLALTRAV